MKVKRSKIGFTKRRYTDIRYAITVLAPIVSYTNFVLIAYNFTDIKDVLPFELFAPLFTVGLVVLLVFVGLAFRKKQQETDFTLAYERSVEAIRTSRIAMENIVQICDAIKSIQVNLGITDELLPTEEYKKRLEYLKKIERREV